MTCSIENLEQQLIDCKKEAILDFKKKYKYGQIFKHKTKNNVAMVFCHLNYVGGGGGNVFLAIKIPPNPSVQKAWYTYESSWEDLTYDLISKLEPVESMLEILPK